jgi:hypothetical protein
MNTLLVVTLPAVAALIVWAFFSAKKDGERLKNFLETYQDE